MIRISKILYVVLNMILLIFIPFKTYASFIEEDVLVKEEKKDVSFVDKILGKKAETVKIYEKKTKYLLDDEDPDSFIKNDAILIEIDDKENKDIIYGYKYYFDKDGYLIKNTVTDDFNVVNEDGVVIDSDLKPILFIIKDESDSKDDVYIPKKSNVSHWVKEVIYDKSVNLQNKLEKVFNTLIDNKVENHIINGFKYKKGIEGKTFTKGKIKNAISLAGNKSFIEIENVVNNFNKLVGYVAMEDINTSDRETICELLIYDKDTYEMGLIDDYIERFVDFNYNKMERIDINFDRSCKCLILVLNINGLYQNRKIYFKDLKFGFSKSLYIKELERKKEDIEEVEELKRLGIYIDDDTYFDLIDEDGSIKDEILDEFLDDDYELTDAVIDEIYDRIIDKNTGPNFDKNLKDKLNPWEYGPGVKIN